MSGNEDGSQKKGKNDNAMKGVETILEADFITTEINEKRFDLTPEVVAEGATEDQLKDVKRGFLCMTGTTGVMHMLTKVAKDAARVIVYKSKTLTKLQETAITKDGVSAENWLFFTTALANDHDFTKANVHMYLSLAEVQAARLFLMKVAHTAPQVMCSKVKFGKAPSTKASTCWYGAKTALGSWYHKLKEKKQRTLNLQESLLLAEQTKSPTKEQTKSPSKDPQESNEDTGNEKAPEVSPTPKKQKDKKVIEIQDDDDEDSSDSSDESDSDSDTSSSSEESRRKKKKKRKQKKRKKKATKSKKKASRKKDVEMEEIGSDMEVEEEPTSKKQSKLKIKSTPTEYADATAGKRINQIRIQLMLKIKEHKKKTANVLAHQLLESFYEALYEEDQKAILMPWQIKDSKDTAAITNPTNFPDTYLDLKKYMDRWRPKKNSTCWVKVRVATDLEPSNMTSIDGSVMAAWYDEYECKGYLCPIQDADKSETIGAFLYSGHFIDHHRLNQEILNELKLRNNNKTWKIACRTKTCKEIDTQEKHTGPFTMAFNQLVHVEAESTQARWVNQVVYSRFNRDNNNPGRPGGYNLRYIPSKTFIKTGTDGEKRRREMLMKHVAVVKSLVLIQSEEVKNLDQIYTDPFDASEGTLRSFLAGLTYPLAPKENQKVSPMFHSIDMAASGHDMGAKVYFTAYLDRATEAMKLVAILPALVKTMVGEDAARQWIHHQCEETEVQFHYDDEGNWLGTFTTEDDKIQRDILDEYMGFNIQLDNMDIVTGSKRRVLTGDDASMKSFKIGTTEGHEAQVPDEAEDGESTAAAASEVTGGGGHDD